MRTVLIVVVAAFTALAAAWAVSWAVECAAQQARTQAVLDGDYDRYLRLSRRAHIAGRVKDSAMWATCIAVTAWPALGVYATLDHIGRGVL